MLQANIVVASQIAKRYGDKGIISVSVHPGENLTTAVRLIFPPDTECSITLARAIKRIDPVLCWDHAQGAQI